MPRKRVNRNPHGTGTVRQRKDGRWEARITIGRDPGTGKQIQKSVYGDTQKEVIQKFQAIQNDISNGTYIEPVRMTVKDWLEIWVEEYTGNLKERSLREYRGQINYRIIPAIGAVKLTALKPHQIQTFYNTALKGSKTRKPVSAKTVKNLHGILHRALEQATELDYIKINPANACKLPRVEKPEINPLTDHQMTAFFEAIKGHQFESLYIVDLFTGMRLGELLGLSWDCVDIKNGTIVIQRQLQRIAGEYKLLPVKNDKARMITPAPSIIQLLQEQKTQQMRWRLLVGNVWDNSMDLVFTNKVGGHLARETVYRNFKRIVKELGIDTARFHDLRHSYAVASLQAGDDIKTVQENLGHHTAAFTLDTYAHVSERMKRESAERMEKLYTGLKKA